jgi:hypothetical protein
MNVQIRNCCWSNKCSKPSIRYTKGCEQGRHNWSQRKKQHNTISMKPQRSSPRGQTTSRNPFFSLFALIFLILYHLNRKHTNFQLNWIEGVAYRNSTIFSLKFKALSQLRVRCLRSSIWASFHGQTGLGGVWLDVKFNSTEFQKKVPPIRVHMQKSWPFYQSTSRPQFWKAEYDSESKLGRAKTCCMSQQLLCKVDPMDGKAQTWFRNESRVGEAIVHARRLAKANRLMLWIGLLFGKVESVSGTNKAQSKIQKLRTQI